MFLQGLPRLFGLFSVILGCFGSLFLREDRSRAFALDLRGVLYDIIYEYWSGERVGSEIFYVGRNCYKEADLGLFWRLPVA